MFKQRLIFYASYPFILIININPKFSFRLLQPVLYFLLYSVIKYRRKIVIDNINRCFKDKKQNLITAKKYYKHLSRIILEPLLTKGYSKNYLCKHVIVPNNMLDSYYDRDKSVFLILGHCNNWEWLCTTAPFHSKYKPMAVYKKMSNPFFERLINNARQKYGTQCIEMRQIQRVILEKIRQKESFVCSFIADQVPVNDNVGTAIFFGQPMYFYDGYIKLAKKIKAVLIYTECKMDGNTNIFTPVLMHDFEEADISVEECTQKFASLLEKNIREQPFNWLWSHNRWKRMPFKD